MKNRHRARWLPALLLACAGAAGAATADPMAERVRACAGCHGEEGRSAIESYAPSIAGKPEGYLLQQLTGFRDGRRSHAVMQQMLAWLSDDYLRDMARYYSTREPAKLPRPPQAAPAVLAQGRRLVEQGDAARKLPACAACHGQSLLGLQPAIPGLLNLRAEYLQAQLGAWRSGTRHAPAPDCMADIAGRLSGEEIAAITAWIASRELPRDHRPAVRREQPLPIDCGGVP
ncbi:cytochrome C [Solimonas fluminis]|uniref:Cytochrome C n=1 Tax=Solimonas fluminis TaxID=2086571 RepID=A0A2S5TEK5_9GAMM|nr:c-type cytochrome [Solimonas fluminis]PPE73258.1 cytochrome C [Solimonas fluminis]